MAKVKLLVDTDIIIDYLKGVKPARALFRSGDLDIYQVTSGTLYHKQKLPLTEKSHPATLSSEKQIPSAKSAKKPADSTIQTSGGEESLAAGGWDVSAV